MKVAVKNLAGAQVGEADLPENIFGVRVRVPLMHQALLRQLANAHLGTHDTQTRAEVSRTTKKMKRQKGTGGARQGSMKAPHWRGGGVAFGPHPHSYAQDMPKKMRRGAVRSALSQKAADQQIILVDSFAMAAPKTKEFAAAMKALGVSKGLIVVGGDGRSENLVKSANNVDNVKALRANYLNIRDIFKYDQLVMSLDALDVVKAWLG
jgi:large subunit ribosomal protein L4